MLDPQDAQAMDNFLGVEWNEFAAEPGNAEACELALDRADRGTRRYLPSVDGLDNLPQEQPRLTFADYSDGAAWETRTQAVKLSYYRQYERRMRRVDARIARMTGETKMTITQIRHGAPQLWRRLRDRLLRRDAIRQEAWRGTAMSAWKDTKALMILLCVLGGAWLFFVFMAWALGVTK